MGHTFFGGAANGGCRQQIVVGIVLGVDVVFDSNRPSLSLWELQICQVWRPSGNGSVINR